MKRGNLVLCLFLVSILFISGCAEFGPMPAGKDHFNRMAPGVDSETESFGSSDPSVSYQGVLDMLNKCTIIGDNVMDLDSDFVKCDSHCSPDTCIDAFFILTEEDDDLREEWFSYGVNCDTDISQLIQEVDNVGDLTGSETIAGFIQCTCCSS